LVDDPVLQSLQSLLPPLQLLPEITAVPVELYLLALHLQSVQSVLPAAEKVFVGHDSVQAAVVSPEVEPNVFAGQRVQEVDPASEYEPGGQVPEQDEFVKPVVEPNVPAGQLVHALPLVEYLPTGQITHAPLDVLPAKDE